MSSSPQHVYARYLLSSRGYPLWIPEPSHELLLHRPDGLRIGDVGVVVPEDGGFDVFFNICLPREHPFHRATGVPDNFNRVDLRDEDIRVIPYVENPGRIISTSSVTKIRKVEPASDAPSAESGSTTTRQPEGYEFDLSSSGGALLILPEGAARYDLRNRRLFFDEATKHGTDWYRFAEEQLGRMISYDSLYLITGFYKTRSWSLAAFENAAGSGEFSAQFKMTQVGGGNIAGDYTWETTRALDWRVGPVENYGIPNQSVFIRGFKIALRTDFLGNKRIEVKADVPNSGSRNERSPQSPSRDSWISKVWKGVSRGSRIVSDMRDDAVNGPTINKGDSARGETLDCAEKHVLVQHMPETPQTFHPSDIINRYLFKRTSANIAITHDDDWIAILEKGQLKLDDFTQANHVRIEETVSNVFNVVSREDAVFLQEKRGTVNTYGDTREPPRINRDTQSKDRNSEYHHGDESASEKGVAQGDLPSEHSTTTATDLGSLLERFEDSSELSRLVTRYRQLRGSHSAVSSPVSAYKVETGRTVGQSPVPESVMAPRFQDAEGKDFDPPMDVKISPPEYTVESPRHSQPTDMEKKSHLLPETLHVPASTQGIHWLLLPHGPLISKHLRFDIIFPVNQICYLCSDNARERLTDPDLDEPAFSEPTTEMTITFEQWPFGWTIPVDNQNGIRCRDVFEAIYHCFDQQLTLGELSRVPDRHACEEAFRIRTTVLGSTQSQGWKRVDVLLHHTIFHGLTMNSRGEWMLNLGVPLPVSDLTLSLWRPPPPYRRDSHSTECSEGSISDPKSDASSREGESSLEVRNLLQPSSLVHRSDPSPIPKSIRSRPTSRPLGPRARHRNPDPTHDPIRSGHMLRR